MPTCHTAQGRTDAPLSGTGGGGQVHPPGRVGRGDSAWGRTHHRLLHQGCPHGESSVECEGAGRRSNDTRILGEVLQRPWCSGEANLILVSLCWPLHKLHSIFGWWCVYLLNSTCKNSDSSSFTKIFRYNIIIVYFHPYYTHTLVDICDRQYVKWWAAVWECDLSLPLSG